MFWQDFPQPGWQVLVGLQLGLHLLRGKHGAAVREGNNVAGVEHLGVPPGQHLQSVLFDQQLPAGQCLSDDERTLREDLTREELSGRRRS